MGPRGKEPSWGPWRSEGCYIEGLCFTSLPTKPSDPHELRPSSQGKPPSGSLRTSGGVVYTRDVAERGAPSLRSS